jgi:pyruvate/2-oxoglutarate dehydrogenase complex dihydrolipoamide dehydrogenase (E3) component
VGRRPKTGDLGLDSVGLEPGRFIEVDDHMRSSSVEEGWLYAIGDVNGRALLTHMAKYHGRVAADHILGVNTGAAEHDAIPRIIFTDPQVAAVGLTTAEGTKRGLGIRTASCDLGDVAGASVSGVGIRGRVRLVVDVARDVLVGATMVGPDTGDMLHAATIAIVGRVPLDRLRHAVPSFPSLSEVWLKAIENYDASREDT